MEMTGNENPFFEYYDDVLDILRTYDCTISLGDALRPGCIDDATDAGQISELIELGYLTERAWAKDVQVMVEGPGHMAMDEIAANMKMQKRLCHNAPFYVLGPLVTDIFLVMTILHQLLVVLLLQLMVLTSFAMLHQLNI